MCIPSCAKCSGTNIHISPPEPTVFLLNIIVDIFFHYADHRSWTAFGVSCILIFSVKSKKNLLSQFILNWQNFIILCLLFGIHKPQPWMNYFLKFQQIMSNNKPTIIVLIFKTYSSFLDISYWDSVKTDGQMQIIYKFLKTWFILLCTYWIVYIYQRIISKKSTILLKIHNELHFTKIT